MSSIQPNLSPVNLETSPGELAATPEAAPAGRRTYEQPDLRVVVFKMAGHEYVADVGLVQEIVRPTGLMHIDGAPAYLEGLVKRRDRLVPVVDLRKLLGLAAGPPGTETCVIIARLAGGPAGFLVDSASELIWVKTRDFETPSPLLLASHGGLDSAYLQGVAQVGGRLLVMLDLERLLTPKQQLTLGALPGQQGPGTLFSGEIDKATLEAEKKQAQARANLRSLVAFELSGELYGATVVDIVEIREPLTLTPLPNLASHLLGLINLRGAVLPVIDLRRRFALPLAPAGPENRLVVLKGPGYLVALWVDRVEGLVRLPLADFQPAPAGVARIASDYYEQVATVAGRMLIELNVHKLLADTATTAGG